MSKLKSFLGAIKRVAAIAAAAGAFLTSTGVALAEQHGNLGIANVSHATIQKIDPINIPNAGSVNRAVGGALGAALTWTLTNHLIGNQSGQRNSISRSALPAALAAAGAAAGAEATDELLGPEAFRVLVKMPSGNMAIITFLKEGSPDIKNKCGPGYTILFSPRGRESTEFIDCLPPSLQRKSDPSPSAYHPSRGFKLGV